MTEKYKWQFSNRFRAKAFGWRGSRLAAKRLKEALSEMRKVVRKDPALAAEGAIGLIEKIWPAFQSIDTSSGSLGAAVNHAVHEALEYPIRASVDAKIRKKWLARLWTAFQDDGVDYTVEVADRWGELCSTDEERRKWVDELRPCMMENWSRGSAGGYFRGTSAVFSCLLSLRRNQEVLDLVNQAPSKLWHYREFGMKALAAMGRYDEALAYAEESRNPYDGWAAIEVECEALLLAQGKREEAYRRFAHSANRRQTALATFHAIADKYPEKRPETILSDLIAASSDNAGKWFASARQLGLVDLAVQLAQAAHCDPRTLNRAAEALLPENPGAAMEIALASLRWICEGWGFEITGVDVRSALSCALKASDVLHRRAEIVKRIRETSRSNPSVYNVCLQVEPNIGRE
jgi:tetratricopeptide (TPR) repeat protein